MAGKMNILEYIDYLMFECGYSEEEAGQMADMEFNPDYDADDYADYYPIRR